ncbi:hypothetical protein DNTS_026600 [Danionella cerebrum]|uniref:Specifically androgen-regulated gene protein n=1 Tax=Danionella cerebrum TaxID=2873325 RepID=A0A553MW34_9TELE|nr:hypothetical protein DNTS_026600 [Danionella translucida]
MPISDIRQAGNGLSTMGEIDRNGSSDSGISFNSCLSDENLEYLSAEEKACLMYLEETIQSLDTEDDSALTNDECVQLPARGNVANKAAHLSASIVLKPPSKDVTKGLYSSGSFEQNSEILNYMVPTPFVLANRSSQVQTKPGSESSQKKKEPKVPSKATKIHQEAPPVSPKTIVVKESKDHKKNQQNKALSDNPSARGPLSYEALVHLRTSASIRKSGEETSTNKVLDGDASRYHLQNATRDPKLNPPTVAPKPKIKLPVHQEGASSTLPDSTMPYLGAQCADNLMNPEKVRMEALCKLGLLKKDTKPQANEFSVEISSLVFLRLTLPCDSVTLRDSRRNGRGRRDSTLREDKPDPLEL